MEFLDLNDDSSNLLKLYSDDLTKKAYITNPAIARENEIKELIMVLLTPDKSALLVGKPGIGKTAIVEGLAYLIEKDSVPNVLKGYRILKLSTSSLVGKIEQDGKEELIIQKIVDELKNTEKVIVFIDEIHTLIGTGANKSLDLANILKPALDRGDIKVIGATTTIEYDSYIIRDRAFLRRFEKIDVLEPDEKTTVKILFESLPRIESQTGIKFKYNSYITSLLIESIVSATSEFKRVYGLSAMYPDIAFSVLSASFSQALFENKPFVEVTDVYNAIRNSKRIYPDSIFKELAIFREKFKKLCAEEGISLPIVSLEEIKGKIEPY